jgi:hypothetical protein
MNHFNEILAWVGSHRQRFTHARFGIPQSPNHLAYAKVLIRNASGLHEFSLTSQGTLTDSEGKLPSGRLEIRDTCGELIFTEDNFDA